MADLLKGLKGIGGWGTVLQAGGQVFGGMAQQGDENRIAAQLRANAVATRAMASRDAEQVTRRGNLLASRAQAVAAASGGGASDPTVVNTIADIQGESHLRSLTAIASGENEAQNLEYAASARKRMGRAASTVGLMSAAGTVLTGQATAAAKYGWNDSAAGQQLSPRASAYAKRMGYTYDGTDTLDGAP